MMAITDLIGEGKKGYALRVNVSGGGCSGMSYNLTFDSKEKDYANYEEPLKTTFIKGEALKDSSGSAFKGIAGAVVIIIIIALIK